MKHAHLLTVCLSSAALAPAQPASWSDLSVCAGPSARHGHAMAYDAARREVVLFGGAGSAGYLGDTWVWSAGIWRRASTTGPAARAHHAMAYDAVRREVVLFGGRRASGRRGLLGDTWVWNGRTWARRQPPKPPTARRAHAMATVANGVLLFGGSDDVAELDDTWLWGRFGWTRSCSGATERDNHAMAGDTRLGTVLLFGGSGRPRGSTRCVWRWRPTSCWSGTGNGPGARGGCELVYRDGPRDHLLFGGFDDNGKLLAETWVGNGGTWRRRPTPAGLTPRAHFGMAWDASTQSVVLFGGLTAGNRLAGDTWVHGSRALPPNGEAGYAAMFEPTGPKGFRWPTLLGGLPPIVGRRATLSIRAPAHRMTQLVASASATTGVEIPFGGLLLYLGAPLVVLAPSPPGLFPLDVPATCSLIGRQAAFQALAFEPASDPRLAASNLLLARFATRTTGTKSFPASFSGTLASRANLLNARRVATAIFRNTAGRAVTLRLSGTKSSTARITARVAPGAGAPILPLPQTTGPFTETRSRPG